MQQDPENLQQAAYERIRESVLYARFVPCERLQFKNLCETLGLGRTPVREALLRLQQEGLVRTIPRSGTYASRIDLRAAECSRFVREHLECEVCVECCALADQQGLEKLEGVIGEQERSLRGEDRLAFFLGDNEFHKTLFDVAGRPRVWEWICSMSIDLDRYRWLRVQTEELSHGTIVEQHKKMLDAIRARDTGEARYLASLHLHMMFDDKALVIKSYPQYFDSEDA